MGGGAWPFLVGGLSCQVDSGNERDLRLLISCVGSDVSSNFLEGQLPKRQWKQEAITGL